MKKYRYLIIPLMVLLLIINITMSFAEEKYSKENLRLTDREIEFLRNNNIFYYAIAVDYPPIEYINSEGNAQGFGIEYLKKASEILNVEFVPVEGFEEYTWNDCLNAIKEEEIDLLPTVTNTKSRRKYIDFTDPYLRMNVIVISNTDNQLVLDKQNLEGSTFVFPKGYWQNEYVESNVIDYDIKNTTNMLESLKVINKNRGQYTFLESFVYNYFTNLADLDNLKIVGELDVEASHSIGVSKNNKLLRDILNKVIDTIPKEEIYESALVLEKEEDKSYMLLFVLVSILIIITIFLLRKTIIDNRYKKQIRRNKQELIENLSHDLKTPLSILKVNVALLKRNILDENEQKKHLQILDNSIDSLDFIIEDLYALTHIKDSLIEKKFTSVNISKFLKEIYDQYKDVFEKDNKFLRFKEQDNYKEVYIGIDKKCMYRAISNLLSNSLKCTNGFDEVQLGYRVEDNKVIITIKDNGIGIDKNTLNHIFDRFYQGESQSNISGKGLGLSITKEIIEMHNGEIRVESKKNKYTTFTIVLPLKK